MHILTEHKLKYLNRRLNDIEELKSSLLSGDYDIAVSIGHRLKGNGETFGFPSISTIGITMEKAGISKDREKIRETIEDLASNVQENIKLLSS